MPAESTVTHLTLAASNTKSPTTQQITDLQSQIKSLAGANIMQMLNMMGELEKLAAEIADGGEAYHPGVREQARVINQKLDACATTIEVLLGR